MAIVKYIIELYSSFLRNQLGVRNVIIVQFLKVMNAFFKPGSSIFFLKQRCVGITSCKDTITPRLPIISKIPCQHSVASTRAIQEFKLQQPHSSVRI